MLQENKEKKFSNHTAARCAFYFRLLASRGSDKAKRLMKKKSYSTQLLTAAGRCKNIINHYSVIIVVKFFTLEAPF